MNLWTFKHYSHIFKYSCFFLLLLVFFFIVFICCNSIVQQNEKLVGIGCCKDWLPPVQSSLSPKTRPLYTTQHWRARWSLPTNLLICQHIHTLGQWSQSSRWCSTLDIPPNTTSMKVHHKPLTRPQCHYLYESIDMMLMAGVIEASKPEDVRWVPATTLAQKAHQGKGLSLEELQHRVNDKCIAHRMEPKFELPPRTSPTPDDTAPDRPKWWICQNFAQINKITKVAAMPQGDIWAKQQWLSRHRWVLGIDFVARFYAVQVNLASRPYTAFYVEGRGYFWYI